VAVTFALSLTIDRASLVTNWETAGMADDHVQEVFELRSKIKGLTNWARSAGMTDQSTLRALDKKSHVICYSTLQSDMNADRMSVGHQAALAKAFGFRIDWREWRNPDDAGKEAADKRADTAKAFLERFTAHRSSRTRLTIEIGPTKAHVDRRFAEFAFALSGSFEPSIEADGIPLVLSLSFDRRGWPVFYDLTVGLKEVDVQLFHTRKPESIEAFALICNDKSEGNFQGNVDGHSPYWIINVAYGDDACLTGTRRRNEGQDCICHGFQVGDEILALMTARVSDCFVRVSGQPFDDASEAKKQFIEHLAKLAALKGAEAKLAEQVLTVVSVL
jgi:hypothetical protein